MGFKPYSIENIFRNRPRMIHYSKMEPDVKELVDYTVKESLKPNPILRTRRRFKTRHLTAKFTDFWSMTWHDLETLRESVQEKNMPEVFKQLYGITERQFIQLDLFNAFAVYRWVVDELTAIAEIEIQELGGEMDSDLKEAGAEALQQFGYAAAVDSLARGDMLKHGEILVKPYRVIFQKMCLDKVNSDIKKQYQENVSRKNKRNS